jgi:hypothetical protein
MVKWRQDTSATGIHPLTASDAVSNPPLHKRSAVHSKHQGHFSHDKHTGDVS